MASENWNISDDIRHLENNPGGWNFFQGIRRLECVDKKMPRIGSSLRADDDPVRFGQRATLAFTPNDIHSYENTSDNIPSKMNVNCYGLLGSNGSMPLFFTEYIYQRCKHYSDYSLLDFINIFHHRMISFFYRAWALFQPVVSCDRENDDYILKIFRSLIGCDYKTIGKHGHVKNYVQAYYSGFLSRFVQSRGALVSVLFDYFAVPVKIEEYLGMWKKIDEKYLCNIGNNPETSSLGKGIIMGEKYWDCKKKFRIKLGPMPYEKYIEFLPGKLAFKHLVEWVKKFNRSSFEWDIQLVLDAESVKPCGEGTLMGYTGWMLSCKNTLDREDLIIENPESKYGVNC